MALAAYEQLRATLHNWRIFLNVSDEETSVTPLLIATKKRHVDIVKELLLANARLDIAGLLKLRVGVEIKRMSPFLCSLLQGYPEIARMLVNSGHDLTEETYLWTNEDVPEFLTLDIEFWLWLQEIISQPSTLMETTRRFLRRSLGFEIAHKIEQVKLPPMLKKYVLSLDFECDF